MWWWVALASLGVVLALGATLWLLRGRELGAPARRSRPRPRPSPAPPAGAPAGGTEPRAARSDPVRASTQILFAEARGRDVQVDCVVVGPAEGARTGSLLGFTVVVPTALPLGDSIVDIVCTWARDGEVVDVELTRAARGWRARFDDGDSTIQLELSRLLAAEAGLGGYEGD